MERHEWSPTERGKALGLCAAGRNSLREVTNIINIPKSTVHDIKTRGTGISKPRSGRPKKLSTRDIRQLIRYIRDQQINASNYFDAAEKDISPSCSREYNSECITTGWL